MAQATALVAGATGHIGSELTKELAKSSQWQVLAFSRHGNVTHPAVQSISVDFIRGDVEAAMSALPKPTHVFYCARAPHKEGGTEDVETNLAMLKRVVEASETNNPALTHVHIVEGGKWYGAHLGPYLTPAREDGPRHNGSNFYYVQEDWLRDRRVGKSWTWSASRPSYVCAVTPGKGRNLISTLGAYVALCRAAGEPLDYPGSERSFFSQTEVTEARLLARAIIFMAGSPAAADQAFNVTNGDAIRWSDLWLKLSAYFQMKPGTVAHFKLAEWAREKGALWSRIVRECALQNRPLDEVADWPFADIVFGQDYDVLSDVSKIRNAGFRESLDTTAMLFSMLDRYHSLNILPHLVRSKS